MKKTSNSYKKSRVLKLLSKFENKQLNLEFQDVKDEDFQYLMEQIKIPLEILILRNNFITNKGLSILRKVDYQKFIILDLKSNLISCNGVKFLSSLVLPNLLTISLQKNKIQNKGIFHLSKSQWKNLKSLSLNSNLISDNGLSIFGFSNWKNLQFLNLNSNRVRHSSIKDLLRTQWHNLKSIKAINEFEYESRLSVNNNIEVLFQKKFVKGQNIQFYLYY